MSSNAATRSAIHDVQVRYGMGVDRLDVDLVRSCFAPHAVADYSGAGHLEGADAIAATIVERNSRSAGSTHFVGGSLVDLRGSRAFAETSCIAYILLCSEATSPLRLRIRSVRYRDGWRSPPMAPGPSPTGRTRRTGRQRSKLTHR